MSVEEVWGARGPGENQMHPFLTVASPLDMLIRLCVIILIEIYCYASGVTCLFLACSFSALGSHIPAACFSGGKASLLGAGAAEMGHQEEVRALVSLAPSVPGSCWSQEVSVVWPSALMPCV